MKIWKISHGLGYFSTSGLELLRSKNLVSIHPNTPAKGVSSETQASAFLNAKKFDLFYVCHSNEKIDIIGMFIDERPLMSIVDGHEDWVDREYVLISSPVNPTNYNRDYDRWWSPRNTSTFIEIPSHQFDEFEELILKPVFQQSLAQIKKIRAEFILKNKMTLEKIQNLQMYFSKLLKNKDFALEEFNNLDELELRKLDYEYSNKGSNINKQPVVSFRHLLVKERLQRQISEDYYYELRLKIGALYENNVFQAWNVQRVLYSIIYSKRRNDVEIYLRRFVSIIQNRLHISDFTKSNKPVHFDGPQNQGFDEVWFAIYNKSYDSQKYALQLYFSLRDDGFRYGLLSFKNSKLSKVIQTKELNFKDLINTYRQFTELIKNDNSKKNIMIAKLIEILEFKGQLILQGAPGTGKTYTATDVAEMMIKGCISTSKEIQSAILEESKQFKLIQFHPAYSYEDFVRGIVANPVENGVTYDVENKTVAEFASEALRNLANSKKSPEAYSKLVWTQSKFSDFVDYIQDELEDEDFGVQLTDKVFIIGTDKDAFRYKGKEGWVKNGNRMLFKDIIQAYIDDNLSRQDVKLNQNLSGLAHHHSSYYVKVLTMFKDFLLEKKAKFEKGETRQEELKNFVLIIDEINRANLPSVLGELIYALEYRDIPVESMYELEGEGKTIILPSNLFIIGTMNTADRSVGHIDYAIRRRFAFLDMLPDRSVIENVISDTDVKAKSLLLFDEVAKLFHEKANSDDNTPVYLSSDFKASDVQVGHSYFLTNKVGDEGKNELKLKLNYEIKPILREYVKDGILNEDALAIIESLKIV